MTQLNSLIGIGKEMERKLNSLGIMTIEEFQSCDVLDTFVRMKTMYPNVCLVHLQVLQGAYTDTEYDKLESSVKKKLKSFYDEMYASN